MQAKLKDFGWFLLKVALATMVIGLISSAVPFVGNFIRNPIGTLKGLAGRTTS